MPEYAFILAGRLGVGKSSLFRRLSSDTFTEDSDTMRGDTGLENFVYHTTLNGEDIAVRFGRQYIADTVQALSVRVERGCSSRAASLSRCR